METQIKKQTSILKNPAIQTAVFLFLVLTIWRVVLIMHPSSEDFNPWSFAWGASYQIVAIWGAVWGFISARSWGGRKSVLGRTILAFSIGLALQAFGQTAYSISIFRNGEAAYPSIGDLGFFGSIPFYIYGVYLIGKLSGISVTIKSFKHRALAVLIPLLLLVGSYAIFLKGYEYDWSQPLTVFLDFMYPMGQAIYIAIAATIFIFVVSSNSLGGLMRRPILFFLIALVAQYFADFVFLYQASRGLYIPEGINDFMYLLSYFLMAISLIRFTIVFNRIRNS